MNRRSFMQLAAVNVALLAMPAPAGPLPLDQSWPLDIREGYESGVTDEQRYRTAVYLDGKRLGRCVAADVARGYAVVYAFNLDTDGIVQRVHSYNHTCGSCRPLGKGAFEERCLEYKVVSGRVEVRAV